MIPLLIIFVLIFASITGGFFSSGPEHVSLGWMEDAINDFCINSDDGDATEHGPQFVPYYPTGRKNKVFYYKFFTTENDEKYIQIKYSRDRWNPLDNEREELTKVHLELCNEVIIIDEFGNDEFQFRESNLIRESMTLQLENRGGNIIVQWYWE